MKNTLASIFAGNALKTAILLLVAVAASSPTHAAVRLPQIFTDDMMLQRDQPIRVWGWAEPGEAVQVALAEACVSTKADATGCWLVELPARNSGEKLELTVKGSTEIRLKNLIMGDIWLCSGQSNMEWYMALCDAAEDLRTADFPKIRHVKIKHLSSSAEKEEAMVSKPWQVCTPQTARGFTGVGFYFAREVQKLTGVPIGLLDDNWGGSYIEAWVAPSGLESVPELAQAAAARKAAAAAYRRPLPAALDGLEQWIGRVRGALADGRQLPPFPEMPADPDAAFASWGSLYNSMIHPLLRFPIKGVLWYQGESNTGEGDIYFHKMKALIEGWRRGWAKPDLPFYFVQLTNFQQPNDDPGGSAGWARLREAQKKALSIPHTGMAVTIDTVPAAVANDVHSKNKYDPGIRLARWALNLDYGKRDIIPSGPLFKAMRVEDGRIRLQFNHIGAGLMIGRKSGREPVAEDPLGSLKRFAIAGADKKWFWGKAVIEGDTVVVSSLQVQAPVAVRYAYSTNPDGANLYNRDGLPAAPFRTDAW